MRALGIDLGTTNSVVAMAGEALDVLSESGPILPSVVAFPPNKSVLVGSRARRRRAIDAINTIFSSKRLIGRRWGTHEVSEFAHRYPFNLVDRSGIPAFKTRAGLLDATEIAAIILGHLKSQLGFDLSQMRVAITVPAGFLREQRMATIEAARRAAIDNVELIDEPIATALAYADSGFTSGRVAVYDLGGGTFELAVVDCESDPMKVLGKASDLYLGGDDLDRALAGYLADEVLAGRRWDLRDNPIVFDRLVLAAEAAKIALATATETTVELADIDPAIPGGPAELPVTREIFERLAGPQIRRTFVLCDQALARVGLVAADVDAVLLAGGSCQVPLVQRTVAEYFGREPEIRLDPMEVVAIGSSILVG
jgi:molecular chaperone DnaK